MTKGNSPKSEVAKWKDKYFAQLEESDSKIAHLTDQAKLLQRMLVRVSMAAEGQDENLDKELSGLRELLRQAEPSNPALNTHLQTIERVVIHMDERRADSSGLVLESLEKLVSQLADLDISKSNKKRLKQFSRQIKNRLSSLQAYPVLLSEYANLQEIALTEKMAQMEPEHQSFFEKLFAGRSGKLEASDSESSQPADHGGGANLLAQTDGDNYQFSDRPNPLKEVPYSAQETELAIGDSGLATDSADSAPTFSSIGGHVGSSLKNLLEQIVIPESSIDDAKRLRTHIESGLNWYELGPTIDDLADLVISAISKGQRDFESFLKHMDDRLARFKEFLGESRSQHLEWQGSSSAFDEMLRGHVDSIASAMEESTEIDDLKASVAQKLDSILRHLSEYMSREQARELSLQEKIDALHLRFKSMEKETEMMRDRLQQEHARALTDGLTELPNRVAYEERMELEYDRWSRYKQPMVLIVADIDHFKQVNDNYGHLAGDKVIQIVAKGLRSRIRKTDFIARYGGEEFAILMPETDVDTAKMVMDKARLMVQKLPFHFRNERVQITMSFGLAQFQEECSKDQQFERADKALYQAKQSGRNRVVAAS